MPNIVLDGDMSTGHSGYPATPAIASSGVSINGINVVVDGDSYAQHCKDSCHTPKAIGSSSVTINEKKIVLAGDSLSCGDTATSSSSVSIG